MRTVDSVDWKNNFCFVLFSDIWLKCIDSILVLVAYEKEIWKRCTMNYLSCTDIDGFLKSAFYVPEYTTDTLQTEVYCIYNVMYSIDSCIFLLCRKVHSNIQWGVAFQYRGNVFSCTFYVQHCAVYCTQILVLLQYSSVRIVAWRIQFMLPVLTWV